jgi:hypothetical protein
MFTLIFILVAVMGLFSNSPLLFLFSVTGLLATIFPVLVLLVIGGLAVCAFYYYR